MQGGATVIIDSGHTWVQTDARVAPPTIKIAALQTALENALQRNVYKD